MSLVRVTAEPRLRSVDISGRQMRPYIHNQLQQRVLGLPGRPVRFVHNRVRLEQVTSMRDSYVNAFLIQSRGVLCPRPCSACWAQMRLDPNGYARPFPYCIRLPHHFGGCCGNCKWPDRAAYCTNRDSSAGEAGQASSSGSRVEPINLIEGASQDDPIVLDDDGTEEEPIELD